MDRTILFQNELFLDTDQLNLNRNAMIALAKLSAAILGTNTQINGLACTPTSPASMSVSVAPGEIYQLLNVDNTPYGDLPPDTTHQILKQGIVLDPQNFSCPAPATTGYAIDYLIQVTLTEQDIGGTSRAFFNSDSSSGLPPIFTTVNQTRQDLCNVQVKAGVAALVGTQMTPNPDPSYVGAWTITVTQGQTTITADNINLYPNAPFINTDESTGGEGENLVIGGNFSTNQWQRGTIFNPAVNEAYGADNFKIYISPSGSLSVAKNTTLFPSISQSGVYSIASYETLVITPVASVPSTDSFCIRTYIEGYNFQKIAQKLFTISFWVYTNAPGTYHLWLKNSGFDQSYVIPYQILNANTWQKIVFTIPPSPSAGTWNYTNGAGLLVSWMLAAGSDYYTTTTFSWIAGNFALTALQTNFMGTAGNIFLLDLVKIEEGDTATPFTEALVSDELLACQRNYEKSYGTDITPGTASTNAGALTCQVATATTDIAGLNATFRASKLTDTPTITFYSPITGAAGYIRNITQNADAQVVSVNYTGQNNTGYPIIAPAAVAGDVFAAHYTAEAVL